MLKIAAAEGDIESDKEAVVFYLISVSEHPLKDNDGLKNTVSLSLKFSSSAFPRNG